MVVKNFYHPLPPTDWVPTLDAANKDALTKFDRWVKASEEVDKQREKGVFTADDLDKGLKGVTKLAKFSKTIADAGDKRAQEEFEVNWEQLEGVDKKAIKDYFKEEVDLTKDNVNLFQKLKENDNLSRETISFLEKNSSRNSLRLRRVLGWENVRSSVFDLDQSLENPENQALQNSYEAAVQTGNVEGFYKDQTYARLNKLGFNNRYIAANFKDEIQRIAQVEGALVSLEYNKLKLTQDAETDLKVLQGLNLTGPDANDLTTEFLSGLIKEHGKVKVASFLHRALKNEEITTEVIEMMQAGIAKDFAGGDGKEGSGKKLFDDKTWDYIISGATDAQNTRIANDLAVNEGKARELLSEVLKPDSRFKNQEQWEMAIASLEGRVSEKTWTKLTNQNNAAQSEIQKNRYLSLYQNDLINGTLDQRIEDIETIPNFAARTQLLNIANKIKDWKEDPNNKTAYNENNIIAEVYTTRSNEVFSAGTQPTSADRAVSADIIAYKRQDLAKRILAQYSTGKFIENPNIIIENVKAVELYKTNNGWGSKDGGKFSLTGTGKGEAKWGNFFNTGISKDYNHNAPLSNNAAANYNQKLTNYPDKDTRYNTVGGIFSTDQLIGFITTGKVSEEMQYIKLREGENMSDLIEMSLDALVNSKEHKDIVERYNLKNFSKEFATPDRIIVASLDKAIDNANGSAKHEALTLQSIFKAYGPEAMSSNQLSRLLNILDDNQVSESIQSAAAKDEQSIETNYQQKIVPALRNKLKAFTHDDGSQLYEDDAIEELLSERGRVTFKNGKIYIDGNEAFSLKK